MGWICGIGGGGGGEAKQEREKESCKCGALKSISAPIPIDKVCSVAALVSVVWFSLVSHPEPLRLNSKLDDETRQTQLLASFLDPSSSIIGALFRACDGQEMSLGYFGAARLAHFFVRPHFVSSDQRDKKKKKKKKKQANNKSLAGRQIYCCWRKSLTIQSDK